MAEKASDTVCFSSCMFSLLLDGSVKLFVMSVQPYSVPVLPVPSFWPDLLIMF